MIDNGVIIIRYCVKGEDTIRQKVCIDMLDFLRWYLPQMTEVDINNFKRVKHVI